MVEGNYETNGSVIGGSLAPLKYKQFWLTKKKKRDLQISFEKNKVFSLLQCCDCAVFA